MKRPESDDADQETRLLDTAVEPSLKKRKKEVTSRVSESNSGGECAENRSDENSIEKEYAAAMSTKKPSGIILKGGRVRLPDKLMEYLNKEVVPEVLYWQTGGESFSFDSKRAQTELLDKYFNGTKLSSFTRSLNRWGFKRIFHALLPKNVLSYEHPCFKKHNPDLVKDMKMASAHEETHPVTKPPPAQMVINAEMDAASPAPVPSTDTPAGGGVPSFVSVTTGAAGNTSPLFASLVRAASAAAPAPSLLSSSSAPITHQMPTIALILNSAGLSGQAGGGLANIANAINPFILQATNNLASVHQQNAPTTATNIAAASGSQQTTSGCLNQLLGSSQAFVQSLNGSYQQQQQQPQFNDAPSSPRTAQRLALQALIAGQQQNFAQRSLSLGQQTQQQQVQQQQAQQQLDVQRIILAALTNHAPNNPAVSASPPPVQLQQPNAAISNSIINLLHGQQQQQQQQAPEHQQLQQQIQALLATQGQDSATTTANVSVQIALQAAAAAQDQQRQAAIQLLVSLLAQQNNFGQNRN